MSNPLTMLTADPKANYVAHAEEIRAAIDRVLESGWYILGPEVAAFEREWAEYNGGGQAVGVANGTEAIELALRAVGVGRGDAVATVANTVSATVTAIEQIGARPVFVDIDDATMLMSARELRETLTRAGAGVKAVLPVHLYGQPADMEAILEVAKDFGAAVVEDCAQCQGAAWRGRKAGAWGAVSSTSFYPTKNLGALGDGGAVFSRDPAVAERVRMLRQYGWKQRYVSEITGRNSRLDEMQAAILRVKLKHLNAENALRAKVVERYMAALAGTGIRLPALGKAAESVWHQFAVRTPRRDALQAHLAAVGIQAGVLYPVPVHRQPAYAQPDLRLPNTEKACAEVLCLPCHAGLTMADVDRVCAEVVRWSRTA